MENVNEEQKQKLSKKRIITYIVSGGIALFVLLGAGVLIFERMENNQEQKAFNALYNIAKTQANEQGLALISPDEAAQVAFDAVGVPSSDVKRLKIRLDDDRASLMSYIYEVDFHYNGLKYDITVDGIEQAVLYSNTESWWD